ncbi:MAG: EmrB/QacA family drug resistance transporter, partial [Burkholderia sp.]|nr:EmrB/QacA family drug resistance transporter [Burkholderia sp.]
MLAMSIISGRLISRLGTYRPFPIAGTLIGGIAMALLSTLSLDTPLHTMYAYMALLGIGLGMVMPVLTLAVQNTVEFRHMGVATSGVTLFRSIGGSLGVAAFGALFSHGLQSRIMQALPAGTELPPAMGPAAVHQLPDAVRDAYLHAFAGSLHVVYLAAAAVIAIAFVLAWFVESAPLRKHH